MSALVRINLHTASHHWVEKNMEELIEPKAFGSYGATSRRYGGTGGHGTSSSTSHATWPTATHIHSFNYFSDGFIGGGGGIGIVEVVLVLYVILMIYLMISQYSAEDEAAKRNSLLSSSKVSHGEPVGYIYQSDQFWVRILHKYASKIKKYRIDLSNKMKMKFLICFRQGDKDKI